MKIEDANIIAHDEERKKYNSKCYSFYLDLTIFFLSILDDLHSHKPIVVAV